MLYSSCNQKQSGLSEIWMITKNIKTKKKGLIVMKNKSNNMIGKVIKAVAMTASESASSFFYEPQIPEKLIKEKQARKTSGKN